MDKKQHRALIALYATDVFLETYRDYLPNTIESGAYLRFTHTLAALNCHVQTQAGAPLTAQGLTRVKDAKRAALLRNYLAPIVRIARMEAHLVPELGALRLPRGAPGIHRILALARGIATTVAPYRDLFVTAGLKPTFVEDLEAAVDDIMATMTERRSTEGLRSGSTKGIEVALEHCARARDVLDAFVKAELHGSTQLLATWDNMKRVGHSTARSTKQLDRETSMAALPASVDQPIVDRARLLPVPTPQLAAGSAPSRRRLNYPPEDTSAL